MSSTNPPPLTQEQSQTSAGMARDDEMWLTDGSLVVVAQGVGFRVHQSILSRSSEIFRDMFTFPQPPSPAASADVVDGCPVVHVSDTSYDFRHLLKVIYGGVGLYLRPMDTPDFAIIAALARLSHKYQIDVLLQPIVSLLERTFPTSFNTWLQNEGFRRAPIRFVHAQAIEAVNLVRVLGRPDMLPTALYASCQLTPAQICRGVPRADGTLERLEPEDVERCFSATMRLRSIAHGMAVRLFVYPRCANPESCDVLCNAVKEALEEEGGLFGGDLLRVGVDLAPREWGSWLCKLCAVRNLERGVLASQREAWSSLHHVFDVDFPSWGHEPEGESP